MLDNLQIEFDQIEKNEEYIKTINQVIEKCYQTEEMRDSNLYINIILTDAKTIKNINKQYRNIDKETDVLSFPMFEKKELQQKLKDRFFMQKDILGDIIISIPRVQEQAIEYGHSYERELSYMVVHGFYHLMGYDHIEEDDKKIMRQKEEYILNKLDITR